MQQQLHIIAKHMYGIELFVGDGDSTMDGVSRRTWPPVDVHLNFWDVVVSKEVVASADRAGKSDVHYIAIIGQDYCRVPFNPGWRPRSLQNLHANKVRTQCSIKFTIN